LERKKNLIPESLAGPSAEYPSTNEPPPVTNEPPPITLGLTPHNEWLAVQENGIDWRRWSEYGLTFKPKSPFEPYFLESTQKAPRVLFALDDLESKMSLEDVFEYGGRYGFTTARGPWGEGNMTNAEFNRIYTFKFMFDKTQFFFKGDGTLYRPVEPPRPFGYKEFKF
jgi:hypothetical protein